MVRCVLVVLAMWVASVRAGVVYEVSLTEPQTQMVDITAVFDGVEGEELEVHLPVWRAGLYLVIDPAGTMREVRATDGGGRVLDVRKSAKSTWRVTLDGARQVRFSYRIYANSIANRTRHVDATHAFLSGSSVFVYTDALREAPSEIRMMEMPAGWRVATGLEQVGERAFAAPNYDILVDSPLEIGEHDRVAFEVDGVPHEVVIWGRWDGDEARIVDSFSAIARASTGVFGELPYARYVFIVHSAEGLSGGTEHYNSTVCSTEPTMWGNDDRWARFLSLIAHELFHTWNVKRFRPSGIARYDYLRENYTELLWVAEGTTSYYDELLLPRAGVLSAREYLDWLGTGIDEHLRTPGRLLESLENSSFDAWIKHFHRGSDRTPDRGNQGESFYRKGALVSLMLDLEIRRATDGERSLDNVMRQLYERFPLGGPGFDTPALEGLIREVAGIDASAFFGAFVRGVVPIEARLGDLLGDVGLRLVSPKEDAEGEVRAFTGLRLGGDGTVRAVRSDGPAYGAGVQPGDEVVAVNGLRGRADAATRLEDLGPGEPVRLVVMRRDALLELEFTAGAEPDGSWGLEPVEQPTEAQREAFLSWTGTDVPE